MREHTPAVRCSGCSPTCLSLLPGAFALYPTLPHSVLMLWRKLTSSRHLVVDAIGALHQALDPCPRASRCWLLTFTTVPSSQNCPPPSGVSRLGNFPPFPWWLGFLSQWLMIQVYKAGPHCLKEGTSYAPGPHIPCEIRWRQNFSWTPILASPFPLPYSFSSSFLLRVFLWEITCTRIPSPALFLGRWFSSFSLHGNHLEDLLNHRWLGPTPSFCFSWCREGPKNFHF